MPDRSRFPPADLAFSNETVRQRTSRVVTARDVRSLCAEPEASGLRPALAAIPHRDRTVLPYEERLPMNDRNGDTPEATPLLVATPMTVVRAMKITTGVLLVAALAWMLWQVRSILVLMVLGILFAAAVEPVANSIRKAGLSRAQSILVVYAGLLALFAGATALISPPLFEQARELASGVPEYLNTFRQQAAEIDNPTIRGAAITTIGQVEALFAEWRRNPTIPAEQIGRAIQFLTGVAGMLFTIATVLIVAFYWMTEKTLIKRLGVGLVPLEDRDRALTLWEDIERRLGGWARGQLVLMLIIGVASTIFYGAIGLPFWFLLGIWAGLTELIPFVGPFLGGGLAVLVALSESWQRAVIVAVFVILLQQIEGNYIVPRVMRDAVGLTPLTVILALLVGGSLLGVIGAVLAIPVAAAVQVLLAELLREPDADEEESPNMLVATGGVEVVTSK
jgi:predicted PurR-regulated permease PerM